jgi:hypothetical protein
VLTIPRRDTRVILFLSRLLAFRQQFRQHVSLEKHVVPISVSSKSKPLLFSVAPIPEHAEFQAIDVPVQAKKGRAKKPITPAVNTTPRMKTRSQTNLQGFKAAPVTSVETKCRKKSKKD